MPNKITLCENAFDPASWQTHDCGDVRRFLVDHFGRWPKSARIYLNRVSRSTDITPYDEGSVDRLGNLGGHFFVVVYPEGFGFAIWALIISIGLAATSIALSFLMRPEIPDAANQQNQSPTNSLTNRTNRERLGGRIPDIYGELWVTPDLIGYPYRIFIGHKEVEYMYLCIGRGQYDIAEIRDDVTPLDQIDGAGAAVYGPYTSPNSGDNAQFTVGEPINALVKNVKPHTSINGQVLRAPNAGKIKGKKNIRFHEDGFIEASGDIDFTDYFEPTTVASPRYLKLDDGASAGNLSGTYEIEDVEVSKITLVDPETVNAEWNDLTGYGDWRSPVLTRTDENWTSAFSVIDQTTTELWCNFVAPAGLYKIDSSGNQEAVSVTLQIEVTSIDNSFNPQGNPVFYQITLKGSELLRQECGATLQATLPFAGACQVRARRLTNTDLRDGYQVMDEVQWRDLYIVSPVTDTDFGNVTTLHTITWPTPQALSMKQRKINVLVGRILVVTEPEFSLDPTPYLFEHESILNYYGHYPPEWSFGTDGYTVSQLIDNNDPAIVFINSTGNTVQAYMTGFGNNQWIGFVICYQDPQHFYLFEWASKTMPPGGPGMRIKKIDADTELEITDIRTSTGDGDRVTVLDNDATGWEASTEYGIKVVTSASGFTIEITKEGAILESFVINDTTYTGGKFGFYTYSSKVNFRLVELGETEESIPVENAAQAIIDMATDPYIGNRSEAEVDIDGILDVLGPGGEVETYFGTALCTQFCHAFDDPKLSFEEMLAQVCQAVFCVPYRQGNLLKIKFEKETADSIILFNHRNKLPGTESRNVKFGNSLENDGIELTYTEPYAPNAQSVDSAYTLYFPEDESAVAAKKLKAVGVRNRVQAWILGWRMYQKLIHQSQTVQFDATAEAALCIISDRILVADNTRNDTQDGEVLVQNGLELTLSQPAELGAASPSANYTIFLQLYDGTVESLPIIPGSAPNKVILTSPPSIALVTDATKYARTTYIITSDQDAGCKAFLLQEKDAKGGGIYGIKAVNYDDRYYDHDQDYASSPRLIDILSPGTGTGSGYSKQASVSVYVDAKNMPWDPDDNPTYDFGRKNGKPPVVVPLQSTEGETVSITALAPGDPARGSGFWHFLSTNTCKTNAEDDAHDAEGDDDFITGTTLDGIGKRYPTYYAETPPLGRMGLMGCWAIDNGDGTYQVVAPFVVGFGGNYTVPAGGVDTLLLGINDTGFSDSMGGLQVIVTQANAAAGDAAAADPDIDTETENPDDPIYGFWVNGA